MKCVDKVKEEARLHHIYHINYYTRVLKMRVLEAADLNPDHCINEVAEALSPNEEHDPGS